MPLLSEGRSAVFSGKKLDLEGLDKASTEGIHTQYRHLHASEKYSLLGGLSKDTLEIWSLGRSKTTLGALSYTQLEALLGLQALGKGTSQSGKGGESDKGVHQRSASENLASLRLRDDHHDCPDVQPAKARPASKDHTSDTEFSSRTSLASEAVGSEMVDFFWHPRRPLLCIILTHKASPKPSRDAVLEGDTRGGQSFAVLVRVVPLNNAGCFQGQAGKDHRTLSLVGSNLQQVKLQVVTFAPISAGPGYATCIGGTDSSILIGLSTGMMCRYTWDLQPAWTKQIVFDADSHRSSTTTTMREGETGEDTKQGVGIPALLVDVPLRQLVVIDYAKVLVVLDGQGRCFSFQLDQSVEMGVQSLFGRVFGEGATTMDSHSRLPLLAVGRVDGDIDVWDFDHTSCREHTTQSQAESSESSPPLPTQSSSSSRVMPLCSLKSRITLRPWNIDAHMTGVVSSLSWTPPPHTPLLAAAWEHQGMSVWTPSGSRLYTHIADEDIASDAWPDEVDDSVREGRNGGGMGSSSSNKPLRCRRFLSLEWGLRSYEVFAALPARPTFSLSSASFLSVKFYCQPPSHSLTRSLLLPSVIQPSNQGRSSCVLLSADCLCVIQSSHMGTLHKSTLVPPLSYMKDNWPLRVIGTETSGRRIAVAGKKGMCLSMPARTGRKWKMFSSVHEEKEFTAVHLFWLSHCVGAVVRVNPAVSGVEDDGGAALLKSNLKYEVRVYADVSLSNQSRKCTVPLRERPTACDVFRLDADISCMSLLFSDGRVTLHSLQECGQGGDGDVQKTADVKVIATPLLSFSFPGADRLLLNPSMFAVEIPAELHHALTEAAGVKGGEKKKGGEGGGKGGEKGEVMLSPLIRGQKARSQWVHAYMLTPTGALERAVVEVDKSTFEAASNGETVGCASKEVIDNEVLQVFLQQMPPPHLYDLFESPSGNLHLKWPKALEDMKWRTCTAEGTALLESDVWTSTAEVSNVWVYNKRGLIFIPGNLDTGEWEKAAEKRRKEAAMEFDPETWPIAIAHIPYCLSHDGLPYALSTPNVVIAVFESATEEEKHDQSGGLSCHWSPRLHPVLSFMVFPLLNRGDIVGALDLISRYFGFDFRNPGGPSAEIIARYGPEEVMESLCSEGGGRFLSTCEQLLIFAVERKELQPVVDLLLLCFNRLASSSTLEKRSVGARGAGFLYLVEVASRAFRSLDFSKWESFFDKAGSLPIPSSSSSSGGDGGSSVRADKHSVCFSDPISFLSSWVGGKVDDFFTTYNESTADLRLVTPFSLNSDGRFLASPCFLFSLSWRVLAPCLRLLLAVESLHGQRCGAGAGLLLLYECLKAKRGAVVRGVFRVLLNMAEDDVDEHARAPSPFTSPSISYTPTDRDVRYESTTDTGNSDGMDDHLSRRERAYLKEAIAVAILKASASLVERQDLRGVICIASSLPSLSLSRPLDSALVESMPLRLPFTTEVAERVMTAAGLSAPDLPDLLEEIEGIERNIDEYSSKDGGRSRAHESGRKRLSKFVSFLIDTGPPSFELATTLSLSVLDVGGMVALLRCSLLQERREKATFLIAQLPTVFDLLRTHLGQSYRDGRANSGWGGDRADGGSRGGVSNERAPFRSAMQIASIEDVLDRSHTRLEKLIKYEGALSDSP
uniref:Uncharacterized protein n=1 Tax=Palpitomonas bilix TaxID=652834 RepID=A0A7S3DG13_9EUKA|mmetsp:Transcript_35277/g.91660  ORF Transcript_35277/g.91660 Transcript_35277/m.91660 type:complete len:1635 (+) Transcript_35277:195-5099(+)